jgi:hypothetical protein
MASTVTTGDGEHTANITFRVPASRADDPRTALRHLAVVVEKECSEAGEITKAVVNRADALDALGEYCAHVVIRAPPADNHAVTSNGVRCRRPRVAMGAVASAWPAANTFRRIGRVTGRLGHPEKYVIVPLRG